MRLLMASLALCRGDLQRFLSMATVAVVEIKSTDASKSRPWVEVAAPIWFAEEALEPLLGAVLPAASPLAPLGEQLAPELQAFSLAPEQAAPPPDGAGLVHERVCVHVGKSQLFQLLHPPLTAAVAPAIRAQKTNKTKEV